MTDLNQVVLIGRLTRDLGSDERSFGYAANGQARANVSIAINRSKKQGDQWVDETSFFDVTIWGKQAESLKPYLTKGTQIAVEGYLKQDKWEKDGQKQSRISIVANTVHLLGGKKDGGNNNSSPVVNNNPTYQAANQGFTSIGSDDGFPEDVPF